jgi:hypothetical protein
MIQVMYTENIWLILYHVQWSMDVNKIQIQIQIQIL